MKTLAAAVQTHLAQQVTTLATCARIVRRDGVRYALTNHDRDLVVGGITYQSVELPITVSAVRSGSDLSVDDSEAEGLITSLITSSDIRAGKLDGATVYLFRVNWQSPSDGVIGLQGGKIGEIQTAGPIGYKIEFRGLTQQLQHQFQEVTSILCRATLFDSRCKLDPDTYEEFGSIASITDNTQFVVSNSAQGTDASATLTNPGGETTDLSGWTTTNVTNSAAQAHAGSRSFAIGTGAGSGYQDVSITGAGPSTSEIDNGLVTIDLKAWVRASATNLASALYVEFYDGSSDLVDTTPVAPLVITPSATWLRRRVIIRVPATSRTARIYFSKDEGAVVYWDDFSVDFRFGQALANLSGDYYDAGQIRFVSGGAEGESIEIRTLDTGTREVELFLPVGTLAVGDQFLIYPGCKRRLIEDCKTKFNNIANFRGEHYTPGKDATLAGPESEA